MIYSASRRTDLPAFHPEVIAEKVRRSRKLEAIVLWTKDPRNCVRHAGLAAVVRRVPTVVQLTLTGLAGSAWEPAVPAPDLLRDDLRTLAGRLPPGAIRWRFDPLLADGTVLERFDRMRALLGDALGSPPEEVTVSFPDPYARVRRRLAEAGTAFPVLAPEERRALLAELHARSGLPLRLCTEPELADLPFASPARCIDGALFDRLYGTALGNLPKDAGQRVACGCVRSTDIGRYDLPCRHGCVYCYARRDFL
jgi:hypothetical protein